MDALEKVQSAVEAVLDITLLLQNLGDGLVHGPPPTCKNSKITGCLFESLIYNPIHTSINYSKINIVVIKIY